jgi:hypothetical protein
MGDPLRGRPKHLPQLGLPYPQGDLQRGALCPERLTKWRMPGAAS